MNHVASEKTCTCETQKIALTMMDEDGELHHVHLSVTGSDEDVDFVLKEFKIRPPF